MTRPYPFDCPRGLNRAEAARYIGVSPTKFDALVNSGAMPQPKRVGTRKIYDRSALDAAFDLLAGVDGDDVEEANDFDHVLE